nr:MerR family transcriptional regulator [Streptomyces geysiriensis]
MDMGERDPDASGGPGPSGGGLSTGEVARRLGVAPTTVRTWDRRYGLGPAAHTGGRHRRWTPEDLARLERMCALTATGLPPSEAARLALDPAGTGGSAPVTDRSAPDTRTARGGGGTRRSAGGPRARHATPGRHRTRAR